MSTKTSIESPTHTAKPAGQAPARERLLAAANELFYGEGVHTVGIDRIIERAGVAKATLYSAFGSKDELIRAYLAARHQVRSQRILEAVERHHVPRERLLGVFDALSEALASPDYHGCPFVNATAEAEPGSPVHEAADVYRTWQRTLLSTLAREAGLDDPDGLARRLQLLYDGAGVSARMDHDLTAADVARAMAETLIDA